MKVLIIDDDLVFGRLLAKSFQKEGDKAWNTGGPDDVMALIKQYSIDLVLLDFNIDENRDTPINIAKKIKEHDNFIPICLQTSSRIKEYKNTLIDANLVDAFVIKNSDKDYFESLHITTSNLHRNFKHLKNLDAEIKNQSNELAFLLSGKLGVSNVDVIKNCISDLKNSYKNRGEEFLEKDFIEQWQEVDEVLSFVRTKLNKKLQK